MPTNYLDFTDNLEYSNPQKLFLQFDKSTALEVF